MPQVITLRNSFGLFHKTDAFAVEGITPKRTASTIAIGNTCVAGYTSMPKPIVKPVKKAVRADVLVTNMAKAQLISPAKRMACT
jgi:hypothetical protein